MVNPLQQTTSADVDALPETTVVDSHAPAGPASSALPVVGTNKVTKWATWDPNQWWTDWTLPPDPRPSWERWFDWVNQLKALAPALGEASKDWQVMIGQFDNSLQTVRGMRADLADWTGPSAQTMSDALDRLENSIATRVTAIRDNPAKLRQLAQTINDAVAPMAALDAEYQQVLADLVACRQVAERGRPIMLNLATQLLRTGTDLENSVQTENLAPQPTPPRPLTLTDGPQGPSQQLAGVAGGSNLAGPSTVTTTAQIPTAHQPTTAGASPLTDSGQVRTAPQIAAAHLPGVAVGAAGQSAANLPASAAPVVAAPTLAGAQAGSVAPTVPAAPFAAAPGPAPSGPVLPVAQFMPASSSGIPGTAAPVVSAAPAKEPAKDQADVLGVVAVPAVPARTTSASGSVAVPTGLRGRGRPATAITGVVRRRDRGQPDPPRLRDETEPLDGEAFETGDAGTGMVTARPPRA
jgi:uncharacterized protein YukE